MHNLSKLFSATLVTLAFVAVPATAGPHEDLAFNVQESNHDKTSGWIVEHLMTFELGDKCYAKVADKTSGAFGKIASDARFIERYAKVMTGDEWSSIENQGANSKDANRALVEKKIQDFKAKFHFTIRVEGEDCEAGASALWVKYSSHMAIALAQFPPKSGRLTVVVTTSSKLKDLTAVASKDGTVFTVTGPSDVEHGNWGGTIDTALKRISTKN